MYKNENRPLSLILMKIKPKGSNTLTEDLKQCLYKRKEWGNSPKHRWAMGKFLNRTLVCQEIAPIDKWDFMTLANFCPATRAI